MKKIILFSMLSFVVVLILHLYFKQSMPKNVVIYRGTSKEAEWDIALDNKLLKFRLMMIQNDICVDDISGSFTLIDSNTYSLNPLNSGKIIMPYSSDSAPGYPLKSEKNNEGQVSRLILQTADFECKNFDISVNKVVVLK